jgi:hypothetical protein
VCSFKCSFKGFRAVQIRLDGFLGEVAMLAWISSQSAYLELAVGLQGTYHCASLLPRCADYRDQLSVIG